MKSTPIPKTTEGLRSLIARTLPAYDSEIAEMLRSRDDWQPLGAYGLQLKANKVGYLPFEGRSAFLYTVDPDRFLAEGSRLRYYMNEVGRMTYLEHLAGDDNALWMMTEAAPQAALAMLTKERANWGWGWNDSARRPALQEQYADQQSNRYPRVSSVKRGQIFHVDGHIGHGYARGYAMVTSIIGGYARLSGYLYVHANPEIPYALQYYGEFRYSEEDIPRHFGPGKTYELTDL